MRARAAVLGVVLMVASVACSDDGDKSDTTRSATPTAKVSDIGTVDCQRYAGVATELAESQESLYNGDAAQRTAAIGQLTSTLKGLQSGAPDDVDTAIDTLLDGFERAAALMDDPDADASALADLAPELSAAGQQVTAYVLKRCG